MYIWLTSEIRTRTIVRRFPTETIIGPQIPNRTCVKCQHRIKNLNPKSRTMKPELKTTPDNAIPVIAKTVWKSGGSLNTSAPDQWRKGMGIHRIKSVAKPSKEVNRLGWRPKGSCVSTSAAWPPNSVSSPLSMVLVSSGMAS